MHHLFKHFVHSIKHLFSSVSQTATTVLSDKRLTNAVALTQLGMSVANKLSPPNNNNTEQEPQIIANDNNNYISEDDLKLIESLKLFLETVSKKTEVLEIEVKRLDTKISSNDNDVVTLKNELNLQKNITEKIAKELNEIQISHEKTISKINYIQLKQQSINKHQIISFCIITALAICIGYLFYIIYNQNH